MRSNDKNFVNEPFDELKKEMFDGDIKSISKINEIALKTIRDYAALILSFTTDPLQIEHKITDQDSSLSDRVSCSVKFEEIKKGLPKKVRSRKVGALRTLCRIYEELDVQGFEGPLSYLATFLDVRNSCMLKNLVKLDEAKYIDLIKEKRKDGENPQLLPYWHIRFEITKEGERVARMVQESE